jgi:hypothetical protein
MDQKISSETQVPTILSGAHSGPEMDIWEPPFERWLRLADLLLPNTESSAPNSGIK